MSAELMDRTTFENFYAGKAPWDLNKPQQPFVAVADRVVSPILDAGCGTGEHSLYFAARGHSVTGIDFVEEAILRAERKATQRHLKARFWIMDATALTTWVERFASVIDCGLFHVFSDNDRRRYVQELARVMLPGGQLFLMCFSDLEPGTEGPRRISRQELHDTFADGWEVESIEPSRFELNPEFAQIQFSEGGPKAWFAIIRRKS
jgi:SAM-dependent methyltransferase